MSTDLKSRIWQPIPFYDNIRKQKYKRGECSGIIHDSVIISKFWISTDYDIIDQIKLISACDNSQYDYTGLLTGVSETTDSGIYISITEQFYNKLPCGLFYWEIVNGLNTWYSEVLKIEDVINYKIGDSVPAIRQQNLKTCFSFYDSKLAVINSNYPIIVKNNAIPPILIKHEIETIEEIRIISASGIVINITSMLNISPYDYNGIRYYFSTTWYNDLNLCGKYQIQIDFYGKTFYSDWLLFDAFEINQDSENMGVGFDIIEDTLIVY